MLVATDDARIFDAVTAAGFACEMTATHPTGTDRMAEVAARHEASLNGATRRRRAFSVRFLGDDVAIADGRYDSLGRNDGGDQRMLTSIVLRREGGAWKIAAIRNMIPTGR